MGDWKRGIPSAVERIRRQAPDRAASAVLDTWGPPESTRVPPVVDVKSIRKRLGMSQLRFAAEFGFSASTVRNWEQGIVHPPASARAFLTVIDREPDLVRRALSRSTGAAPRTRS